MTTPVELRDAYQIAQSIHDNGGTIKNIVDAVAPVIGANALRWVADQKTRWDGYCCHDHMAAVVSDAAVEIELGVAHLPVEDADAILRRHQANQYRDMALGLNRLADEVDC